MPDSNGGMPIWAVIALSAAVGAAVAVAVLMWQPGLSPQPSVEPPADGHPPKNPPLTGIAERILPSVVSVTADLPPGTGEDNGGNLRQGLPAPQQYRADPFQSPDSSEPLQIRVPPSGMVGSGWVCRSDGFIATNLHLVSGRHRVTVRLQDLSTPQTVRAELWGADARTDTAVLKVEVDRSLRALSLKKSTSVEVGEQVLAAGTPFGLEGSVTAGIVSAPLRFIPARHDGHAHEVIQIDAAITSGSSGGPVVDAEGRLVGMSVATARSGTAAREIASYGFAIPASTLRHVIPQLIKDRRVRWASMGCTVTPLSSNLKDFFGAADGGVLVTNCFEDSPAEDAGIRPDDVIVSIAGQRIQSTMDVRRTLMAHRPGETISVGLIRDQKRMKAEVQLTEAPEFSPPIPQSPAIEPTAGIGLEVKTADPLLLGAHGLEDDHGVVVMQVQSGSLADGIIRRGDLVRNVGGTPVTDASHYRQLIEQEMASGRDYTVLHLHRREPGGSARTVVTDIPLPDDSADGNDSSDGS